MSMNKLLRIDFTKKARLSGKNLQTQLAPKQYEPRLGEFIAKAAKSIFGSEQVEFDLHVGDVLMAWTKVHGTIDATLLGTYCHRVGAHTWRILPGEKRGELIIVTCSLCAELRDLADRAAV